MTERPTVEVEYTASDLEQAERRDPRVVAGLEQLGAEHEPPPGWEQRVLDEVKIRHRRRGDVAVILLGLVLMCALAFLSVLLMGCRP